MQVSHLILVIAGLSATSTYLQATGPASSNAPQPASVAIVELFTSEGCSSCPPADALLRQIHLKETSAGQLIVGLSEHVTYWNSLGWKDPYSDEVFTQRQSAYASKLSLDSSYTPQMVLNGRDQFVGSNSAALQQALRTDASRKHADLKILSSTRDADGLQVNFSLGGTSGKQMEIMAVLTDDMDQSKVLRGENSGRSLQHISVARSLSRVATISGDSQRSIHLRLPNGFTTSPAHHLVLFAQEPNLGLIVGGATVPL